jgi:hypothetical protein
MASKRPQYKSLILVFLITSVYLAPFLVNVAYAQPLVSLDPKVIIDTTLVPGSTFDVNIVISGVTDLHSWMVEFAFDKDFLNTTLDQIQEGQFLKDFGATNFRKENIDPGVLINSTLVSGGASGSGILASVTFLVKQRGYTKMSFYNIYLKDSAGSDISYDSEWDYGFRNVENMYVEPPMTIANPSETFSLDVKVANVTDVYGWQCEINWGEVGLMSFVAATEGDFLKGPGIGTTFAPPYVSPTSVFIGASRLGLVSGAFGSGLLATVTLKVENPGNCTLALTDTKLINSTGGLTAHTTQDAYFHSTKPVSAFEYLPLYPSVGEVTTFNATACYDPDGGSITSYTWNFGDGMGDVIVTNPFINHTFTEHKNYTVNLTVTDDDVESWRIGKYVTIVQRDVSVNAVNASHTMAAVGEIVSVDVTVRNNGDIQETFNLTAYYGDYVIGIENVTLGALIERKITFEWNTTGVGVGIYTLKAVSDTLPYEINITNNEFINGEIEISGVNRIVRTVAIGGVTFYYVIESNSSIVHPVFNGPSKEISFNTAFFEGQERFSNVTIPMRLLNASSPNAWTVKLDGNNITYTTFNNGTHYTIYFNFTGGTHEIQIIGTSVAIAPVASFTAKTTALTHETVTFNATASYDPDGTIVSYYWTFGDGATANETGATTAHFYTVGGRGYNVTLWVTDNSGFKTGTWKQLNVNWLVDVAVVDVQISSTSVTWGESVSINVTVANQGDSTATFNVTVTYDSLTVSKQTVTNLAPGGTTELHFVWNTTSTVAGTYNITCVAERIPGEGDISDNSYVAGQVTVSKKSSSISLSASLVTFNIGDSTVLSGAIIPSPNLTEVYISYRPTGGTWTKFPKIVTNEEGAFTYSWKPNTAGTYELKVEWSGDSTLEGSVSSVLSITVNKTNSILTIELSEDSVTSGSSVTISGAVSPVRVGASVTILSSLGDGDWSEIATTTTNENGQYTYVWSPSQSGTYGLKATWQGDDNTKSAESETKSLTVQPQSPNIVLYAAIVIVVIAVAVAIYLLKFRKR